VEILQDPRVRRGLPDDGAGFFRGPVADEEDAEATREGPAADSGGIVSLLYYEGAAAARRPTPGERVNILPRQRVLSRRADVRHGTPCHRAAASGILEPSPCRRRVAKQSGRGGARSSAR